MCRTDRAAEQIRDRIAIARIDPSSILAFAMQRGKDFLTNQISGTCTFQNVFIPHACTSQYKGCEVDKERFVEAVRAYLRL